MVALSYDYSTLTGTITAAQFAANFADLNGKFGSIYGSDIHPRAGIVNTQLRDRFSKHEVVFTIAPFQSDASWDAGAQAFTFPGAATLFSRRRIKVPAGYLAYLCSIEIYALDVTVAAGTYPQVRVAKNAVAIPGADFLLNADSGVFVFERTTSPFSSPLLSFANNDYLDYYIMAGDGATTTTTARGVIAQENWKHILIP